MKINKASCIYLTFGLIIKIRYAILETTVYLPIQTANVTFDQHFQINI